MMKVIGYRKVDFKAQDGNQISGRNVFVTFDDQNITGLGCEKLFLGDNKFSSLYLNVGDQLDVRYNRYGRVDTVEVLKSSK